MFVLDAFLLSYELRPVYDSYKITHFIYTFKELFSRKMSKQCRSSQNSNILKTYITLIRHHRCRNNKDDLPKRRWLRLAGFANTVLPLRKGNKGISKVTVTRWRRFASARLLMFVTWKFHFISIKWFICPISLRATCSSNFILLGNRWECFVSVKIIPSVYFKSSAKTVLRRPAALNEILHNNSHMENGAGRGRDLCHFSFSSHKFHQK